jgi:molecular chaperone GrpE
MEEQSDSNEKKRNGNRAAEDGPTRNTGGESESRRESNDGTAEDNARSGLSPDYVAELESRTRAAEQQVQDVRSRFEQMRGELERQSNETRERLTRAADERALGAKTAFVMALLPVWDNLQLALENARESGSPPSLIDGLERTASGFERALSTVGVEPVRSIGEPFDPKVHEAVDAVDVRDDEDGLVTREYNRGYRLGERLLRPARVQVGRTGAHHRRAAPDHFRR